MLLVVTLLVFVLGAGAVVALYGASSRLPEFLMRRRLENRIWEVGTVAGETERGAERTLIKEQTAGPLPALDHLVGRTEKGSALGRWLEQSGLKVSISGVLLISAGLSLMVFTLVAVFTDNIWAPMVGAAIGAAIPFSVIRYKRGVRMRRFEEHFPEALDLMSRAIRAGHALTTGMKMVADEMGDPVGPEFRKTFDEQNFGLPLKDALNNLSHRMPLLDVKFFATAVLIQRETGGNLSEILENLAHVVRERFKILRQVRVHTAHGRFTGYVLLALPAALAVALYFINPDHMNLLFREKMGQTMLLGALVMQVVGYLWIKQIIKIEV